MLVHACNSDRIHFDSFTTCAKMYIQYQGARRSTVLTSFSIGVKMKESLFFFFNAGVTLPCKEIHLRTLIFMFCCKLLKAFVV